MGFDRTKGDPSVMQVRHDRHLMLRKAWQIHIPEFEFENSKGQELWSSKKERHDILSKYLWGLRKSSSVLLSAFLV